MTANIQISDIILFPHANPETGEEMREKRYRLKDNYTRFYLRYIEPQKKVIDEGAFSFASLDELDGIETLLGFALSRTDSSSSP